MAKKPLIREVRYKEFQYTMYSIQKRSRSPSHKSVESAKGQEPEKQQSSILPAITNQKPNIVISLPQFGGPHAKNPYKNLMQHQNQKQTTSESFVVDANCLHNHSADTG